MKPSRGTGVKSRGVTPRLGGLEAGCGGTAGASARRAHPAGALKGSTAAAFCRILSCKPSRRTSVSTFCISVKELDVDRRHFEARRVLAIRRPFGVLRDVIAGQGGHVRGEGFVTVTISCSQ